MIIQSTCASTDVFRLGESPTWDDAAATARWVDIDAGRLYEAELSTSGDLVAHLAHSTTAPLSAAIHTADGGLLLAQGKSLVHLDAQRQEVGAVEVIPRQVQSRLNDGGTDPAGRFLVGSLSLNGVRGQEKLWRLESSGELLVIDDDLSISNGLGWSPDKGTLYSVDSIPGSIWQRSYDPDSGDLGSRRHFVTVEGGEPDGLTVDTEGNVWVAVWGAGEVRGYSPAGTLTAVVTTGASLTTSCAFIGPDLRTLLITSAGKYVSGMPTSPEAGRLFTTQMPYAGQATTPWAPVVLHSYGGQSARIRS